MIVLHKSYRAQYSAKPRIRFSSTVLYAIKFIKLSLWRFNELGPPSFAGSNVN